PVCRFHVSIIMLLVYLMLPATMFILLSFLYGHAAHLPPHSFPTRRSSDLLEDQYGVGDIVDLGETTGTVESVTLRVTRIPSTSRSEEHTSELQSRENLVCRLLLEKKNT